LLSCPWWRFEEECRSLRYTASFFRYNDHCTAHFYEQQRRWLDPCRAVSLNHSTLAADLEAVFHSAVALLEQSNLVTQVKWLSASDKRDLWEQYPSYMVFISGLVSYLDTNRIWEFRMTSDLTCLACSCMENVCKKSCLEPTQFGRSGKSVLHA
jgi:hypothetical protein